MFLVAGGDGWRKGRYFVLKPAIDPAAPPICVGFYDSEDEAEGQAEHLNDELVLAGEEESLEGLENLPEDMTCFLRALG